MNKHLKRPMDGKAGCIKWAVAKHALSCLIGCNIGEGTGAALGYF